MASGKTLSLQNFSRHYLWRGKVIGQRVRPQDREPRDRSLNGKDRIRARKARNKRPSWLS